jgi:uncharacterized protein with GYD domain
MSHKPSGTPADATVRGTKSAKPISTRAARRNRFALADFDRNDRGTSPTRYEAAKALVTRLGGRLVCAYVTTGQYDVVLVVEMPNGNAMTKLAVPITSSDNARTTTVRAFQPEEFGKLAAEAP